LVWDADATTDWRQQIADAVATVRQSSIGIVAVGIEEGEFRDRSNLGLPGHQEELIDAVAKTGRPIVVVMVGGSAITTSRWIDKVAAVLDAWYPGVEGGHAIADVLFGSYNPAGRLPVTFPIAEGQLPMVYNHKPTGRGDDYLDLTGQPAFPFGFGLSYTRFSYENLAIDPGDVRAGRPARVSCRVRNTGDRAGDEVVQLYIRDLLASVSRPVTQLAAFRRLHLVPGEAADISFELSAEQLKLLDRTMHWVVEPGAFRVMVGGSSRDIRLRGEFVVR
jgi:beta-glucosidase